MFTCCGRIGVLLRQKLFYRNMGVMLVFFRTANGIAIDYAANVEKKVLDVQFMLTYTWKDSTMNAIGWMCEYIL